MIKNIACALLATTAIATPVFAADMPVKAKAPAIAADWSGFYVGATVGARWANNSWTTTDAAPTVVPTPIADPHATDSFNATAARFGGLVGYNWTFASVGLIGIEADAGIGGKTASGLVPGTHITIGPTTSTQNIAGSVTESWDASLRGRLGVIAAGNTLVFATGGVAWQHIEVAASCGAGFFCIDPHDDKVSTTRTGWTVGGGIEHRLDAHWILRADYRYADFGTFEHTFFTSNFVPVAVDDRFTAHVKTQTHTANVGLVYKF